MSISEPFVRRPIATSLLMGGIFLVGLVVFPLLPVAPLPQVDFPTILVTAQLPGASPETMASSVATPLEYQFAEISGLSQMTSTNVLGTSQITLQFDLNRNIDAAAQDVQTGIDAAGGQLPKNLPTPPTYRKVNPADSPILILAVHSDVLPVTTVDDYAENILAQQISQIPGIAQVNIGGQQKPAVRVQIDPTKIAALGLQMEDVANVINTATVDAPKGSINGPTRAITIYDNDQLLKAAPWNDVVVAYKNGAPVRIRDIGVAVDGPENTLLKAWQNGHDGILLLIYKQPGANVIDAEERVERLLPHALASVPPSIKVDKVIDRTTTIKASVRDVEFTLLLTIALVVMVIFLFLRNAWATIIPGVTVPLALLGTAAMMYVLDYSLDNLSLMALTIAVGFVVDDAIVMLENIYRHIEDGLTPLEATLKGAGEIGFTIMSISISLIAVFIPLLLMGGIIGRLFREFAITMTMTIVISAFVSLTLSPTMCALFLRDERHAVHGRLYMIVERAFDRMLAWYTRGLDLCLDHKRATLDRFSDHARGHRGAVHRDSQGILPAAGYRNHRRGFRRAAGHLLRRNGAPPARAPRRRRQGPRRRELRHRSRRQPAHQQRLRDHRPEAARSAQRQRRPDHQPAAAATGQGAGRDAVHAGGAGPQRRRTHQPHAVPVHAAGLEHRRAQRVGAEAACEAAEAAHAARRGLRPADQQRHVVADHRPRPGGAFRHSAGGDRPDAVRRLRPAAGRAVLHPAQQLPRGPGNHARACNQIRTRSRSCT